MLGALRRHSKSFIVYLLFAMIIVVFVFTFNTGGAGSGGCVPPEDPVYARVAGHSITADNLVMAMQVLPSYLAQPEGMTFALAAGIDPSQLFRQNIEELTPAQADGLLKLVEAIYLASDEADRLGFSVDDKELAKALYPASFYKEEEVTGDDGLPATKKVFQAQDFDRWVKYGLRASPQAYEEFTVAVLLAFKLQHFMNGVVKVEPVEAELSARARGTKVDLAYVEFRPDFFEKLATVTDEAVAKHLKENEEAVKAYYDSHPFEFHSEASYSLAGIYVAGKAEEKKEGEQLLPTPEEMTAAKARAQEIRDRLDCKKELFPGNQLPVAIDPSQGEIKIDSKALAIPEEPFERFKEVAKRESDHAETKARSGIFAGWKSLLDVNEAPLGEPVAKALAGAEKDALVGPVETPEGYWIIYVQDAQPARNVTLEEAQTEIAATLLKKQRAPEAAKAKAEAFRTRVLESEEKDLAKALEGLKAELKDQLDEDDIIFMLLQERKTGKFHLGTANFAIPGIGPYQELFEAAFRMPVGSGLDKLYVHPDTNRAYVVKVVEKEIPEEKIPQGDLDLETQSLLLTRQIPYLEAWLKSLRQTAVETGHLERTEEFTAYISYLHTRIQEAEERAAKEAAKAAAKDQAAQ